jgi:RecJ-like exonuclease
MREIKDTCPDCNGEGGYLLVGEDSRHVSPDDATATGELIDPCDYCNGEGTIWVPDQETTGGDECVECGSVFTTTDQEPVAEPICDHCKRQEEGLPYDYDIDPT